ncbi:hypothetical protein ACU686_09085 [Yinghuangia aomiensis]
MAATVLVWGTLALYLAAAVAFTSDGIGDSAYDDGGPDHTAAKYLLGYALAGHAVSLACVAGRIARHAFDAAELAPHRSHPAT